ncbi:MAG TPA: DEAD/DEAH box helicase [Candidatus Thiothrix moscowensis]|uniref:DEAD/DEAH box helicase n=1 Tax=unclassified Thiothrix TaxID=2636184 RepID=UPI0025DD1C71|nr:MULTISPECIES: DEAD/DEAH box helicase [unclassified Thiothrix]HRJ53020.1 DEAD/DEAH box helicase [Candidatus Thiothrix moscowensis]HRJ92936.1 DEAD/DEAH box helicase [Candidatus Thiothrix moscowensis]
MSPETNSLPAFTELGLAASILQAVQELGYETPSAIQAETIPYLLEGRDVLGQAQTGTGKTAAFALPLLSRLDLSKTGPQILVLAPTRELAIQVAEAFQKYAGKLPGFHVMPIYGGQDYRTQFRQLERGVHVVVGTPGRVMDHLRRETLKLDNLQALVLDEADEMLRMGFIEDIEWIMEQTPVTRQIALFSATMPPAIHRIAQSYLNNPAEVKIKVSTTTAETIRQRYWLVSGLHKLDALTRILEAEPFDAVIIFVRTKNETVELADKLQARGYGAVALNGDIPQNVRERTIDQLKKGKIDILIATDVAARGLDVERISHVINYDIPTDTESYVHRIGRTGRAGRSGDAILFVSPRERHLLRAIERATRKPIELMELPSTEVINNLRIAQFKQRITDTLEAEDSLDLYQQLISDYEREHNVPAVEVAAALARLLQGDEPMLLEERKAHPAFNPGTAREREPRDQEQRKGKRKANSAFSSDEDTIEMQRFRLAVGRAHGVKPGNIVGAIANEAGLDSRYIGHIDIQQEFSLVDLPAGMPKEILHDLKRARVAGQMLNIELTDESAADYSPNRSGGGSKRQESDRGERRPRGDAPASHRRENRRHDSDDRRPRTDKPGGSDRPRFGSDRPAGADKPRFGGDKPRFSSDKPRFADDKTHGSKPPAKKKGPDKDKGKPKRFK